MAGMREKKDGWGKWAASLAIIIAVAAGFYWLGGLSGLRADSADSMGAAVSLGVLPEGYARVARGSLTETVYGEGSLVPLEKRDIYNGVEGTVASVDVDSGNTVRAGDVLMHMENDDNESDIAQLEATLFSRQVELSDVRDEGSDTYIYAPCAGRLKVTP
jgi:multidrug efflux pump subunit AcrA (membrane-fusion protein)